MPRLSSFDKLCSGFYTSKVRCTLCVVPVYGSNSVIDLRRFSQRLSEHLASFSTLYLVSYKHRRYNNRYYVRYALEGPVQDIYAYLKLPTIFMSWYKIKIEEL